MSEKPKVSVIMPSLNVAPYIRECIESVINQTLREIEIICVDAGSTDGTLEALEEYAARDQRIKIIHSDMKSYGHQMNLGIDAAKGEYIGIVETDDYIEADMYRTLSEIADKYQLDILKADFKRFWGDGTARQFEHRAAAFKPQYYNTVLDPFTDNDVFRCNSVPWSGLYRTSFLKEKQVRLNESPGASYQDNGLWWQTFTQAHRVMFVDQSFYRLRRDNPNSSVKAKGKVYCMCEEYDYIRSFLHQHPELEARYASLLAVYRMHNYNFTLNRIAPEFQLEFLQRYAADFRKLEAAGELDRSLYTKAQWGRIHKIMECPEYIYYLDYYKDGQEKAEKARQKRRADQLQDDLDSIYNSASYRIGRRITWLPRKLCGGVQCYRDHGAGYTLRRTLYHMGMWEDEENPDYNKQPLLKRFSDCCSEHSAPYTAWRVLVKLRMAKDGEEPALIQRLETESPVKKKPAKAAGPVKKDYAYYSSLPPEKYPEELKLWYKRVMKEELDLDNPKTYNEKIQWLKLYDSTPLKTRLADKYLVREWVKQKIGEEYLIPLLGVWDSFDEIDFDKLPNQFVLKANHGSGWNIIVKDKSTFDIEEARKKFDLWMHTNFAFRWGLEFHYMNIPPKIIAEKYIENLDQLIDYKVWCSDGKARFIWVDTDRYTEHKRTVFSLNWERIPVRILDRLPTDERIIPKPLNLNKMIQFAEQMSIDFALVRVDFYEVEGKLYFGEMTFTSGSGTEKTDPREFEYEMGSWITLPPKSPIPMRLIYQEKRPEN